MAVRSLETYAVTEVLSEYLEIDNEIWLYWTCRAIHIGNKGHINILTDIRNAFYSPWGPPTLQDGIWDYEPPHLRSRGTNGTVVEMPKPWYYTWAELRFQNLYDRRPETMPLPSPISPDPVHDQYDDDDED